MKKLLLGIAFILLSVNAQAKWCWRCLSHDDTPSSHWSATTRGVKSGKLYIGEDSKSATNAQKKANLKCAMKEGGPGGCCISGEPAFIKAKK